MISTLLLPEFLDGERCVEIVGLLRASNGAPALVYGTESAGAVHASIRTASRIEAPVACRDFIIRRLEGVKPTLEQHFQVRLSLCEEPQFLHYRPGDFFVAHQDGNTPLIRDQTQQRRVSIVLFLNDPATYGGGELLFHGAWPDWMVRQPAPAAVGTLIAFPAETTHEVTPVTHGERFTIVSWYR